MGDAFSTSMVVEPLVRRYADGDADAGEELLRHASARLERIVRKQLREFPDVRRWEQTGDVLQEVLVRLWRATAKVRPRDARHFFALAAQHIRWVLMDLKKHHVGPLAAGSHHQSGADFDGAGVAGGGGSDALDPSIRAQWAEFHSQVESMPGELRDVVDMVWYNGLKQEEAADLLQVSSKTVSRRWREARMHLGELLLK
jgi:RNA polymerase sigma factor (sigma-70 family)